MDLEDFNYLFDEKLVAKYPLKNRDESKLLAVDIKKFKIEHRKFYDIIDYINPGDVIAVNSSYVKKARIFGKRETGGKVEIFVLDFPNQITFPLKLKCLIKTHKKIKENETIIISPISNNNKTSNKKNTVNSSNTLEYIGFEENSNNNDNDNEIFITALNCLGKGEWEIIIQNENDYNFIFDNCSAVPLPPYIKRKTDKNDEVYYQTIYANKDSGFSVAAPTAGLHFTEKLIDKIKDKGGIFTDISLNIGLGTFAPVREKNITNHNMHEERYKISKKTANIINNAIKNGNKLIATGTSSVRCLESSAGDDGIVNSKNDAITSLYIYPGYKFKITKNLITNFHQPKSSLFIMISALIGLDKMKILYEEAINNDYKFFSYGDAMFLYNID
ncbi:MAG: tRNA preQ1(34) S-adenosylmethionine ribosyltransferase-isomerase QueA [bacterium]